MSRAALDLIFGRIARLMLIAKGSREAYLTTLVLLQQSLKEVALDELDGFMFVVAGCSLALKLADEPRDLCELVRHYVNMVKEEMGKGPSARESEHLARMVTRVKGEQVMILIRNQFNLSFQHQPIPIEPGYLRRVAERVLNEIYKSPACLLLDGKALAELSVLWAARLTEREADLLERDWGEAGAIVEEVFDQRMRDFILSKEYLEANAMGWVQ